MSQINIRMANLDDAMEIYSIYEPYILNTVITFEVDKVPVESFRDRMKRVLDEFPWIVCEVDRKVVGYAYCSTHNERAAYSWDCQCSIYLNENYHHKGIGTALYNALFKIMKEQGYYNIYSLICVPNDGSVGLHKKFGFTEVGTYYKTAYKFGQWRDVLVMEKHLRETLGDPKPIISVQKLDKGLLQKIFQAAEETVSFSKI